MTVEGKVWGSTQVIFNVHGVLICRLEINTSGACSVHRHKHRWNLFRVEMGLLEIYRFKDDGTVDKTILGANTDTIVPAGEWHCFRAGMPTVAFEMYWCDDPAPHDIERLNHGAVMESKNYEKQLMQLHPIKKHVTM